MMSLNSSVGTPVADDLEKADLLARLADPGRDLLGPLGAVPGGRHINHWDGVHPKSLACSGTCCVREASLGPTPVAPARDRWAADSRATPAQRWPAKAGPPGCGSLPGRRGAQRPVSGVRLLDRASPDTFGTGVLLVLVWQSTRRGAPLPPLRPLISRAARRAPRAW